jgi:hypothetical protein
VSAGIETTSPTRMPTVAARCLETLLNGIGPGA